MYHKDNWLALMGAIELGSSKKALAIMGISDTDETDGRKNRDKTRKTEPWEDEARELYHQGYSDKKICDMLSDRYHVYPHKIGRWRHSEGLKPYHPGRSREKQYYGVH